MASYSRIVRKTYHKTKQLLTKVRDQLLQLFKNKEFWLVIGTWALVGVTMYSTRVTTNRMQEQVDIMEKSLRLQWRPYLNLNFGFGGMDYFPYYDGGVVKDSFGIKLARKYSNNGATLLTIRQMAVGVMTSFEWECNLKGSSESLVTFIRSTSNWRDTLDTDVVIKPNDSLVTPENTFFCTFPHQEIEDLLRTKKDLILYPYFLVEYADFNETVYNALLIQFCKFTVRDSTNNLIITFQKRGIKKYRYDVLVPSSSAEEQPETK